MVVVYMHYMCMHGALLYAQAIGSAFRSLAPRADRHPRRSGTDKRRVVVLILSFNGPDHHHHRHHHHHYDLKMSVEPTKGLWWWYPLSMGLTIITITDKKPRCGALLWTLFQWASKRTIIIILFTGSKHDTGCWIYLSRKNMENMRTCDTYQPRQKLQKLYLHQLNGAWLYVHEYANTW